MILNFSTSRWHWCCHYKWPIAFDKNGLQHFLKTFLYSDATNGSLALAVQSVLYDRTPQRLHTPLNDRAEARSASGVPVPCCGNKNPACLTVPCTLSDLEQDETIRCATTSTDGTSAILWKSLLTCEILAKDFYPKYFYEEPPLLQIMCLSPSCCCE